MTNLRICTREVSNFPGVVMGAEEFAQVFVKEVFRLQRISSPWCLTEAGSVTHKFLAKVCKLLRN